MRCVQGGRTALIIASRYGHAEVVGQLLDNGANVNAHNEVCGGSSGHAPRPERGNGKGDPASRHARTTPAVLHHRRSGDAGGAHTPMNRLWFPLCTWELADLHVSAHQSFERSACAWCLCASPHRYVHMQPVHMCSCLFFLCAERCIGHVNVHVCCARV